MRSYPSLALACVVGAACAPLETTQPKGPDALLTGTRDSEKSIASPPLAPPGPTTTCSFTINVTLSDGRKSSATGQLTADETGRTVAESTDGGQMTRKFDVGGRIVEETDPTSKAVWTRDEHERIVRYERVERRVSENVKVVERDAEGKLARYLYTRKEGEEVVNEDITFRRERGRLVEKTVARGTGKTQLHFRYAYGADGKISSIESTTTDGRMPVLRQIERDSLGRPTVFDTVTEGKHVAVKFAYDDHGRWVKRVEPEAVITVAFEPKCTSEQWGPTEELAEEVELDRIISRFVSRFATEDVAAR